MNDFPNAPASSSALFDNAPTVPMAQPAHTTPAVRIGMVKGGTWVAVPHPMQYGQPMPLELALKRVAIGRTVIVQPGDAGAVMEAVTDCGDKNG